MPLVTAYHRPGSIAEALSLLAEPHRTPLAGGTVVNADRAVSDLEVVDLQALGLAGIESGDGRVRVGAMTTLAELAEHHDVPALLRRLARLELPSTLRTLATIGGTVAVGAADSVLLAGLLAHDAEVELSDHGSVPLSLLLVTGVPRTSLVTAVEVDAAGDGAFAATGRTPADAPIVAVVGRRAPDGVRLALTGVHTRPVLVEPGAPTADLDPPGDFRGSTTYRLELARVLASRVVEELG